MNEIELLNKYRKNEPGPDANELKRSRLLLQATIAQSKNESTAKTSHLRFMPRFGWRQSAIAVVSAAAIAIFALPALFQQGTHSSKFGSHPTATSIFNAAADAAAADQPKGKYSYVEYIYGTDPYGISGVGHPSTTYYNQKFEYWVGKDGSGRMRIVSDDDSGKIDRSHIEDEKFGPWKEPSGNEEPGINPFPPASEIESIPTNGQKLHELLLNDARKAVAEMNSMEEGSKPSNTDGRLNYEVLTAILQYVSDPRTTPEQRATLYREAASVPNVTVTNNIRDHEGREGVGISISDTNFGNGELQKKNTYIFSRDTAELIGTSSVLAEGKYSGREVEYSVYNYGSTNSLNETP